MNTSKNNSCLFGKIGFSDKLKKKGRKERREEEKKENYIWKGREGFLASNSDIVHAHR
jgi:hypothetical protein